MYVKNRLKICLAFIWTFLIVSSECLDDKESAATTSCSESLGLTSRQIEDWQLAASSAVPSQRDPNCAVKFARLHQKKSRAWCAEKKSKDEWILVDLGVKSKVTGVVTQGRGDVEEWVTAFVLSYSMDAFRWDFARDIYGNKKVFRGNSDSYSLKHSYLEHPIEARFIKIYVSAWHDHPSLRLEVIGCQDCNKMISALPFAKMTASSYKHRNHIKGQRVKTCLPEMGHIYSDKGWCPRRQNVHQWFQFDIGPPTTVTGLVTLGQGDRKRFVSSYTLSYSNDSSVWFFYKDAHHLEAKIFGGNMDSHTERRHYLNEPFVARYVRIHPQTWHKKIGLRAGLLGCPHKGACGQGFFQVNEGSACISNKAFGKKTWTSDKRGSWKEWKYGHSSLAVDGSLDTNLPNCAILNNYDVENPLWVVDLGKIQTVDGVVILTWQGKGQDQVTSYTDYVHSLEKLTVYVSKKKHRDLFELQHDTKCASITRKNNAIFNPKLHFECPEVRGGRYIYVKASGLPDRWRNFFTVVLCEVMVY